jgi:hypothetical protein
MKIAGKRMVEVEVDPMDAIIKLQEEWTSGLNDIHDKEAYIKDGWWYADDRYGPDQIRKATKEEKEVFDSYMTIIQYMRNQKKQHGTETLSR